MTAVATRPRVPAPGSTLRVLAGVEARRFARHPLFLAGVATCVIPTVTAANDANSDVLGGDGFFPALLVGVVSMVVAYQLTRSTRRSAEALHAVPTAATTRTGALCLACVVPAAAGVLWLAVKLIAIHRWPPQPWMFGTFGLGDRFAILAGESVLACLGAPLLGVAAGRWLRIRGGAVLLVAGVTGWVTAGFAVALNSTGGLLATGLRLSTPFTVFLTSGKGYRSLDSWTGSPWWYLLWLVALCGLATIAALLHGATGGTRTRLLRVGALFVIVGLLAYGLAVTGGLRRTVTVHPDGTRTAAAAR